MPFRVVNETSAALPRAAFRAIALLALGSKYDLTLIVTNAKRIKLLNAIYTGKRVATDVLSFPISARQGEIYMCLTEVRKGAGKFGRTYANFISFLFIHACVHLKGHDHGAIMEGIEVKLRKKFGI